MSQRSPTFEDMINLSQEMSTVIVAAIDMREKQKLYFKTRSRQALIDAKIAEKLFDTAVTGPGMTYLRELMEAKTPDNQGVSGSKKPN